MFANTSIRTLLSWGFGIVIALTAVMAAIIFQRSSTVADHVAEVGSTAYPKVAAAAELRLNVMRNWANTLLLLQVTDSGEMKRVTDEMAANSKVITGKFEILEKLVVSATGKQQLGAMLAARKDYTE
ncbi:MAG: MCP four helix bundle domain-containing protein, partial [Rhodocyclaceae bacterium]|nr:MCP four helix bundle domain-containing protein [Rhodocyclaceae bacterium]